MILSITRCENGLGVISKLLRSTHLHNQETETSIVSFLNDQERLPGIAVAQRDKSNIDLIAPYYFVTQNNNENIILFK